MYEQHDDGDHDADHHDHNHHHDNHHESPHHPHHVWMVVTFLEAIAQLGRLWYRSRAADGRSLEKHTFVWPLASSVSSLP